MRIFFHMLLPRSCPSKWCQWLRIWLSRNIRFVGVNVGMSARNRHFQTNYWCITIYVWPLSVEGDLPLNRSGPGVGGDTWSTYVRPSGSRLPFYVRRTLIGFTEEIQIWVDIFSLSGADLTGQCHSQFEVDRINICAIFETIRVIQGQHGLPQSRFKRNESIVLASKWRAFLYFTWKCTQLATRLKIVSIGRYVGVLLIFAGKDSLFALGDIVSFVTHFVEGKSERTLIEGRRCSMDVRSSFSLKCTILKGLHQFWICKYGILTL